MGLAPHLYQISGVDEQTVPVVGRNAYPLVGAFQCLVGRGLSCGGAGSPLGHDKIFVC